MTFPSMEELGFKKSSIKVPPFTLDKVYNYEETRNFPSLDSTSKIGPHLRFGTISIREIVSKVKDINDTYLSELVWREFFYANIVAFSKELFTKTSGPNMMELNGEIIKMILISGAKAKLVTL